MSSMVNDSDLQVLVTLKDEEVKKLKALLGERDEEIQELKTQLDKYKSVLSIKSDGFISAANVGLRPRKNRLLGISDEPQDLLSDQEVIQTKLTEHLKSPKLVHYLIGHRFRS
jgi:hypothetical protein